MPTATLLCTGCGRVFAAEEPDWSCPACSSPLRIDLDLSASKAQVEGLLRDGSIAYPTTVWSFAPVLPDVGEAVSLGEGGTPIVRLRALGAEMGVSELYAKLEFFAPTGSFKDRGTTVMVSRARSLGISRLVEDSSGNAGASIAAYCARAGIAASIYVPTSAPRAKKDQIAFYGAEVVAVEGTRDRVAEEAMARSREEGSYYASHNWDPYFLEGTKTFAYEAAGHFLLSPPEHLVIPVANGSLFLGSWKGFEEMLSLGIIDRAPRHHVAQATGYMPIVDAFRRGLAYTEEIPTFPTVAGGISIGRPSRGRLILETIRKSGGAAAAVSDDEILRYQRLLARLEGIFCEPTSAAALAAVPRLVGQGAVTRGERVLVAITGIGLKDPDAVRAGGSHL